ncbi:hypothetical protein M9978_06715 [Sphingomonas sp. MG17]|uniref:Glycerophosphoryl diester phosphodiesterase membrane domain-containing protein n=1 Tax=Sphingomonas tagetis TaxID=2949092 RepID=A0A9X2KK37_9SPHN|nr:hypothetical protein [Sphingomonas tagetis]MCP3730119.1 hypothetical protein [Sphingomonas tagetis]
MRLPIGGVLADAAALWRAERDVVARVAGVFFLLPVLALAMLVSTLPAIADRTNEEAVFAAVRAFYVANFAWLLLVSLALDFGGFALLSLFLRGGRTVGELLTASLLRLVPFVLIGFLTGTLINLGFALYVIPGLYIFGRSWLMGAAYAAEPERGLLAAIERGFRLSAGNGWRIALLGCGTAAIAGSAALVMLVVAQTLTALAGNSPWVQVVALVPVAAAGAAAFVAFTLVRVAIYRRLAGSSSGT